jgi:hypothetical protein
MEKKPPCAVAEGPSSAEQSIFAFAVDFRAPSFLLFSAERVGYQ